jgi:hypothetical protein
VRGVALGRANWTFAGSDAGGHRAATVYTLIETCKLNDVNPQPWIAYVLAKLPDHPAKLKYCPGVSHMTTSLSAWSIRRVITTYRRTFRLVRVLAFVPVALSPCSR